VKLAVVVQRYGRSINGGAELHARYIAGRLARHADVEVLTTCAVDYVTWRNEVVPGLEHVDGIPVRRFAVARERNPKLFARRSARVFDGRHSIHDELKWLAAEGPCAQGLIRYLGAHAQTYDYCLFVSYRYYHAYYGIRAVGPRAILVPTAERDPAIGLAIFPPIFRGVRALMYNSPEERAMIQAVSGNRDVPGVVVGVGSEVPQNPQPARFRHKYNVRDSFAVYIGRIDSNKGCEELFAFFEGYIRDDPSGTLSLILIGNSLLPVPQHPRIRHLGFLTDDEKFDAIAAADLLIMPSYFESLSMVALEAWGLGRPVLANGKCDVLKGQCIRSNAGLYYESYPEFLAALRALERNRWLSTGLGRNGRQFYREHYDWAVIEGKYLDMFARLTAEAAGHTGPDPLPGWLDCWRRIVPPARDVLAGLPSGPALESRRPASAADIEEVDREMPRGGASPQDRDRSRAPGARREDSRRPRHRLYRGGAHR
jgi:glycosyltransferase involved in cell wall biosynthesis